MEMLALPVQPLRRVGWLSPDGAAFDGPVLHGFHQRGWYQTTLPEVLADSGFGPTCA